MACKLLIFALGATILSLFPVAVLAEHVCVYCIGAVEYPDASAQRLACKRDSNTSLDCPTTGPMPDCDDTNLFQPQYQSDLPDGCQMEISTQGSQRAVTSYECVDQMTFQGQNWDLRAVIVNMACPDEGSIWTQCSYSTPLCQTRVGIRPTSVGSLQAAQQAQQAPAVGGGIVQAPAPESEGP